MKLTFRLRHEYTCHVCERNTLPALNNRDHSDPSDPDRYKWCVFCHHTVPYAIRRKKSYQRRWDKENEETLYQTVLSLREEIEKR